MHFRPGVVVLQDVPIIPAGLGQYPCPLLAHPHPVAPHLCVPAGAGDAPAVMEVAAPDVLGVAGVSVTVTEVEGVGYLPLVQHSDLVGRVDRGVGTWVPVGLVIGLAVRGGAHIGAGLGVPARGCGVASRRHRLGRKRIVRPRGAHLRGHDPLEVLVHVHYPHGAVGHQHPDGVRNHRLSGPQRVQHRSRSGPTGASRGGGAGERHQKQQPQKHRDPRQGPCPRFVSLAPGHHAHP